MNVYAISDLHLSTDGDKPMHVFGGNWEGHFEKIKEDWFSLVQPDDIVLVSGDISWAMKLSDALADLQEIAKLPGKRCLSGAITIIGGTVFPVCAKAPPTTVFIFCKRTP